MSKINDQVLHHCHCSPGCRELTGGRFAHGHDQKLISWLKWSMRAGLSADSARREALARGAGAGLMLRLETTIRRGGFE